MADGYPYIGSAGPIAAIVSQLRKAFPKEINKDTLQKLGIAPKNESYLINILRFLKIIDDDGKKVTSSEGVFLKQKDEDFYKAFEKLVKTAYTGLFELHKEAAWTLSSDDLIQFFRTSDKSSDTVGKRQAKTFIALAGLSGHGDVPVVRGNGGNGTKPKTAAKKTEPKRSSKKSEKPDDSKSVNPSSNTTTDVGLTVRIEVNLPASGDKSTYDNIFSSIRKNFIEGR